MLSLHQAAFCYPQATQIQVNLSRPEGPLDCPHHSARVMGRYQMCNKARQSQWHKIWACFIDAFLTQRSLASINYLLGMLPIAIGLCVLANFLIGHTTRLVKLGVSSCTAEAGGSLHIESITRICLHPRWTLWTLSC